MMRVSHVLSGMSFRYGGPPRVACGIGKSLRKRGVEVDFRGIAEREDRAEVFSCFPSAKLYETSFPKRWYRAPLLRTDLAKDIQSFDLFHLHEVWSYPQFVSSSLAAKISLPYIVTPHGELEPWRVKNKFVKKVLYLKTVGRNLLRRASCLHAITPLEVDGIRSAGYSGPIAVIPNGVDCDLYDSLPSCTCADKIWPELTGKKVVLYLARISPEKGLDIFLPAWKKIVSSNEFSDAILVIAGPDDRGYKQVVEEYIQDNNLSKFIKFTGMVDGFEKLALFSRALFYTLPSHSEGFSVSILESLASSTPVLITDACNFPDVADSASGIIAQPTTESIYRGLIDMLRLPREDRESMGSNGRSLVLSKFSWDKIGSSMYTLYEKILSGNKIPNYIDFR